jgi:hypothetical protein
MPNVNAFVGLVESVEGLPDVSPLGVEPAPGPAPPPPPPPGQKDIQVRFRGGKTVFLSAMASRYVRWALQSSRQMNRPVYATLADDDIEDVQIPVVGRVTSVRESQANETRVAMDSTAQALVLSTAGERDRIHALLETAAASKAVVMVVANTHNQIVDADLAPPEAQHLAPAFTTDGAEPLAQVTVSKVSASDLTRVFSIATGTACAVPPNGNCIPFNYPVHGCEARAHKVCGLLAAAGFKAGKLWLFGELSAHTTNHEFCDIGWEWHVAPYVRRQGQTGRASIRVIDPTLHEDRAVTLTRYLNSVNGGGATLLFSDAKFYQMGLDGAGSLERTMFTKHGLQSEDDLEAYREEGARRRPQPPYVCPV